MLKKSWIGEESAKLTKLTLIKNPIDYKALKSSYFRISTINKNDFVVEQKAIGGFY